MLVENSNLPKFEPQSHENRKLVHSQPIPTASIVGVTESEKPFFSYKLPASHPRPASLLSCSSTIFTNPLNQTSL